ncbi:MAG: cytochrome c peroxidase, partial [Planctomycetaceae bacterium]
WLCLLASGVSAWPQSDEPFSQKNLLDRFDRNRNRRLDADERTALRQAVGIDIPWLPDQPYDYQSVRVPAHIDQTELDLLDTTPPDNPVTDAGAALGRVLFYDHQLSANATTSCASCHQQKFGFSDTRRFSRGFEGGRTGRNSMSLANLRYSNVNGLKPGFFWDERAATLEQLVLMPIQDGVEMGMTLPELEQQLAGLSYYPGLFRAAFSSKKITSRRIAHALAQFLRSMVSFNSRFDRNAAGGKRGAETDAPRLTEVEQRGRSLFMDGVGGVNEFACQMCHVTPSLNMDMSHNIGLGLKYRDKGLGSLNRESNSPFTPSNDGKFKAPSLRNVALSGPYMHDGRFKTLREVVEHYSDGIHPHLNLTVAFAARDQNKTATSGFGLTKQDQAALVAFLKTLTDEEYVTDPRFADPFIREDK